MASCVLSRPLLMAMQMRAHQMPALQVRMCEDQSTGHRELAGVHEAGRHAPAETLLNSLYWIQSNHKHLASHQT